MIINCGLFIDLYDALCIWLSCNCLILNAYEQQQFMQFRDLQVSLNGYNFLSFSLNCIMCGCTSMVHQLHVYNTQLHGSSNWLMMDQGVDHD